MALFTLIVILLFHAPAVLAASGNASSVSPDTRSAVTPEAPPPACLDCGLRYFPPMKKSEKAKTLDSRLPMSGMTEKSKDEKQDGAPLSSQGRGQSSGASGGLANGSADVRAPATAGRSHLSSDRRVNTARALIERQRYAEALAILAPLVPDHPDQTDVRFLIGLASSRGAQAPGLEDEQRLALLDQAIAAFRSILIRQTGLGARAFGTGPGLLSETGRPVGPRAFRTGPGRAGRLRLWLPISTVF